MCICIPLTRHSKLQQHTSLFLSERKLIYLHLVLPYALIYFTRSCMHASERVSMHRIPPEQEQGEEREEAGEEHGFQHVDH